MRHKFKYFWWFLVAVFAALAFFNIFTWPHDSKSAMTLFDKIDNVVFRPAAHPTMFALVVGLAVGTVLLPEIWRVIRDHIFPAKPRPNMDMTEAIEYLRVRSRWAVGRVYENKSKDRVDFLGLLEEQIDTVVRDAATQERVTIWGRPPATSFVDSPIEIKIPSSEWTEIQFDLTTMVDYGAPHGVCARDRKISEDRYCQLRVNRREVYEEWPPAFFGTLLFDKTWKSRRKQICE